MSKHVAYLSEPAGYDLATRTEAEVSPGITVVKACRPGSKTIEGMAYEFDASMDRGAVVSWITDRNIDASRFHFAKEPVKEPAKEESPFGELVIDSLTVGTHYDKSGRKLEATRDLLSRMVDNTKRLLAEGKLRAPVKLGHDKDQSSVVRWFPNGGAPNLGYLNEVSFDGSRAFSKAVQVPRKLVRAVQDKFWFKPSLELNLNWNGQGPVITGVALLGDTKPADKALADVLGLSEEAAHDFTSTLFFSESTSGLVFCFAEGSDSTEGDSTPGGPDDKDAENQSKNTNQETMDPPDKGSTMSDELLKAKVAELEAANKTQLEAAKQAIADTLEFCVGDTITPAQLVDEKAMAMNFSTPEQVAAYVASVRKRAKVKDDTKPVGSTEHKKGESPTNSRKDQIFAFSESRRKADGKAFQEGGRTDVAGMAFSEAEAELMALCEQEQKDKQCTYLEAYNSVALARPELASTVREKRWEVK